MTLNYTSNTAKRQVFDGKKYIFNNGKFYLPFIAQKAVPDSLAVYCFFSSNIPVSLRISAKELV